MPILSKNAVAPVHFLILAGASVALLFIISQFSQAGLKTRALKHATIKSEMLAGLIADNFAKTAEGIDALLDNLNSKIDPSVSPHQIRDTLATKLLPKSVVQVSVVDDGGRFIASNIASGPPVSLADRAHIKVHFDGKIGNALFIGHPVTGRISRKVTVQFTKAYRDERGALYRILVASYLLDDFIGTYQKLNLGPGAQVRIVGFDGVDRVRYDWPYDGTKTRYSYSMRDDASDILQRAQSSVSGVFQEERSSKRASVGAFVRVDALRVISSVSISWASVDRESSEAQRHAQPLQIGASIMVIGFAFAAFWMRERQLKFGAWMNSRARESNLLRCIAAAPNVRLLFAREGGDIEVFPNDARDRNRPDEVHNYLTKNWRSLCAADTGSPEIKLHRTSNNNEWRELAIIAGTLPGPDAQSDTPEFFVLALDQTSFREQADRMYQMSKLASMGELAAGLAHEISQPLGTISLSCHNAQGALDRNDAGVAADKLHLIQRQVGRIRELINHLRRFGRSDSGTKTHLPIEEPICGLMQVLQQQCRLENIELKVDGAIEPGVALWGNCNEIEQVLINLVQNARQAILDNDRSQQEDAAGRIVIKCVAGETEIVMSVRDNGGGIPAAYIGHIFKPFFTTKPVGEGTGLGLSIAEKIVRDHGGRLEAGNVPGGAEVRVFLPRFRHRDRLSI